MGPLALTAGTNCVAAPGISASSLTAGQFFAVIPGQTETFTFGYAASDVSVYIGSLDDENSLTINYAGGGSTTYTGDDLAAISDQIHSDTGRRLHDLWLDDQRPLDVHQFFARHHSA